MRIIYKWTVFIKDKIPITIYCVCHSRSDVISTFPQGSVISVQNMPSMEGGVYNRIKVFFRVLETSISKASRRKSDSIFQQKLLLVLRQYVSRIKQECMVLFSRNAAPFFSPMNCQNITANLVINLIG